MKKTNNRCPKCNEKLSPFYMKQTCPHCGVNLMYYQLDERLEQDAQNAAEEVRRVNEFTDMLKASTVKTPLHILRLILFFTPLASMCLPMYWAGHKEVSLIGFILSIVNHGFDMSVWTKDYLFAVLAMVGVIVFSLAVIIGSLFSSKKGGLKRNLILSAVNTAMLITLSVLVIVNGGELMAGCGATIAIFGLEFLLHFITDGRKIKQIGTVGITTVLLIIGCGLSVLVNPGFTLHGHYGFVTKTSQATSVISFNVAAPWGTAFDGTKSEERAERFVSYIEKTEPDFIGTQELNSNWTALFERIKTDDPEAVINDYEFYAVKRGGDDSENTSEMNGIFWKKDKYTVVEKNTFWLSQTPEKESRFTYTDENGEQREAGCHRICSYAVLIDKETRELFAFLNTHLDNASEEARNYGAELILKKISEIKAQYGDLHIILTGDFNQTEDGVAYQTLTSVLNDTTDKRKAKATWQDWGYTNTGDKPIDFIFTDGKAKNYELLDDLSEGYVSDHYGILAEINW